MIGCGGAAGLTLVFFGVLFLLENLGVGGGLVGKYWPVILIVLGLSSLYNMRRFRVKFNRFRHRWPPDLSE